MDDKNGSQVKRPSTSSNEACQLLEELYGLRIVSIKELVSFVDRNFEVVTESPLAIKDRKGSQEECNHFIMKIYNSKDSADGNRVELSVGTMDYLWHQGYPCPRPVPNIHGNLCQRVSVSREQELNGDPLFMVVLVTFLPGNVLSSLAPAPPEVFRDVGRHLATLHHHLKINCGKDDRSVIQRLVKGFMDYNQNQPSTYCSGEWSLVKLPTQRRLLALVEDEELRQDVERVIDMFEEHIVSMLPKFREGIIHGDFNEHNILVAPSSTNKGIDCQQSGASADYAIAGIIDFGEVAYSCLVFDIAITLCEIMTMKAEDQFKSAAHVLEGYRTIDKIPEDEAGALYHLVLSRYAQHILLSLEAREQVPDNEYIMMYYDICCKQLQYLLGVPKRMVEGKWNLF